MSIDHTTLHMEYLAAGLHISGTNFDGSPNFVELAPEIRDNIRAGKVTGVRGKPPTVEEIEKARAWEKDIPERTTEAHHNHARGVLAAHIARRNGAK